MRKIFRVYFKDVQVDIEESDINKACENALKFLRGRQYTFHDYNITKAELIAEPITLLQKGDE